MNVGKVNTLLDVWISVLPRVRPFYAVNCNSDSVLMQVLADKPHIGFYCRTKENVEKVYFVNQKCVLSVLLFCGFFNSDTILVVV